MVMLPQVSDCLYRSSFIEMCSSANSSDFSNSCMTESKLFLELGCKIVGLILVIGLYIKTILRQATRQLDWIFMEKTTQNIFLTLGKEIYDFIIKYKLKKFRLKVFNRKVELKSALGIRKSILWRLRTIT